MKTEQPHVSVIVCAYNAERYLQRTLRSLCGQTYRNIDILVIDDASTDRTAEVAERASETDERIRVVRLPTNGGIARARQFGLESAVGPWIAFLDADDLALPEMIEKQVSVAMSDDRIMGVSTYSAFIGEDDDRIIGEQRLGLGGREEFFRKYEQQKLMFLPVNTLFLKDAALSVGGFRLNGFPSDAKVRHQDFSEDVDLWSRMSDLGRDGRYFVTIQEPLLKYRKIPSSLSARNVFAMLAKMRWIKDCLRRRRAGLPERSFDEFRRSASFARRVDHLRTDSASLLYRQLGFCLTRHQYVRAIPLLAAVCALSPGLLVEKARVQRWSRKTC